MKESDPLRFDTLADEIWKELAERDSLKEAARKLTREKHDDDGMRFEVVFGADPIGLARCASSMRRGGRPSARAREAGAAR